MNEIMLVDLSSIAFPIYMTSAAEPDPNRASQLIVARVRALTSNHPNAAICCDAGRSFRKDLSESYKANRPPAEAMLHHQIALAKEQLEADGFPVWSVKGFEADDLIATAASRALALPGVTVLIVSADKDLLQLVGPRVRAMSVRDGSILDEMMVMQKFCIRPDQMRDYLTLVGDASDNVKGAKGIGPKKAADLLAKFDTLDNVYIVLKENAGRATVGIQTSVEMALREFQPQMETTRSLIALRADVDLPFEEISRERVAKDAAAFGAEEDSMNTTEAAPPQPALFTPPAAQPIGSSPTPPAVATPPVPSSSSEMVVHEGEVLAPVSSEWERQLEPRSIGEAINLAKHMYASRLFSAYGTAQGVLATMLAGRELGMQAMASLRGFDIIDGRPTFKADLIRALVLKSGKAKYFRCTARSAAAATFITQRGDEPPIELTYTIEEGKTAWSKTEDGWSKSGWGKNPADMLVARAGAKLARLVYPDVVHGLYSPEEFD